MDRIKATADEAGAKAMSTVQDVQTKRELAQAYQDLGRATYELIEQGAIDDQRLAATAARVHELLGGVHAAQ